MICVDMIRDLTRRWQLAQERDELACKGRIIALGRLALHDPDPEACLQRIIAASPQLDWDEVFRGVATGDWFV